MKVISVTALISPYVSIFMYPPACLCTCVFLRVRGYRCEALFNLPRPGHFIWSDAKRQMLDPLNWRWLNVTRSVISSLQLQYVKPELAHWRFEVAMQGTLARSFSESYKFTASRVQAVVRMLTNQPPRPVTQTLQCLGCKYRALLLDLSLWSNIKYIKMNLLILLATHQRLHTCLLTYWYPSYCVVTLYFVLTKDLSIEKLDWDCVARWAVSRW